MITKSMTKYLLVPPRKGYYNSLASLQRVMSESDYDDPMSGLYGEDEVEECFNDASSMSSFMY